jgi:hypothetical protein
MSMVATKVAYLGVRYASALASPDMRSGVSNPPSANVSTATMNMSTKVFTATSTEMFTATAMAAPTALRHRRLSAQIYQRAERNGHCKYFDKAGCHRRTPPRKGNLRQSIEFHKADISHCTPDVRFASKADARNAKRHVRFTPQSGHVRCN